MVAGEVYRFQMLLLTLGIFRQPSSQWVIPKQDCKHKVNGEAMGKFMVLASLKWMIAA
jgi:hypothetical protein